VAEWLTLLLRIREVLVSNLGLETGYPEWELSWFFSVPPGKWRDSALRLGRGRFLSNSFQFIIPLFDAILVTQNVTLNKLHKVTIWETVTMNDQESWRGCIHSRTVITISDPPQILSHIIVMTTTAFFMLQRHCLRWKVSFWSKTNNKCISRSSALTYTRPTVGIDAILCYLTTLFQLRGYIAPNKTRR
jgi:hypothetical protein